MTEKELLGVWEIHVRGNGRFTEYYRNRPDSPGVRCIMGFDLNDPEQSQLEAQVRRILHDKAKREGDWRALPIPQAVEFCQGMPEISTALELLLLNLASDGVQTWVQLWAVPSTFYTQMDIPSELREELRGLHEAYHGRTHQPPAPSLQKSLQACEDAPGEPR